MEFFNRVQILRNHKKTKNTPQIRISQLNELCVGISQATDELITLMIVIIAIARHLVRTVKPPFRLVETQIDCLKDTKQQPRQTPNAC